MDILDILRFLAVLSVLILVHEFGHFYVAKKFGVWVEEFGLGYPPRAIGKKIRETIYSLNWLPIGGFVRLHGENLEEKIEKPKKAFLNKAPWKRALIIVAGVAMNFFLAFLIYASIYTFTGLPKFDDSGQPVLKEAGFVQILEVAEGSPADQAGVVTGDIVVSVDSEKVVTGDEFVETVKDKSGEQISLTVERRNEEVALSLTPRVDPPEGEGAMGVVLSSLEQEKYFPPAWKRPFLGAYYGFREAMFWGMQVVLGFILIIKNLFSGVVPQGAAGPVGLLALTTVIADEGIVRLMEFVAIISVNLAVLNMFPIPPLDGGRLIFVFLHKIFGKKKLIKIENYINVGLMMLLILLMAALTYKEAKQIYSLGIGGFVDNLRSVSVQ